MKLWNLRLNDSFILLNMLEESGGDDFKHYPNEIELRNIYFKYPESSSDVLKGVSVTINRGDVYKRQLRASTEKRWNWPGRAGIRSFMWRRRGCSQKNFWNLPGERIFLW